MAENTSNTPFDDVYRTLAVKTKRLMIPLINFMFNRQYPMDIPIVNLSNEAYTPENEKLCTDAKFAIGNREDVIYNIFIIEEQTNQDNTIPIRLYEYMLSHASSTLNDGYKHGKIIIPSVGVLNLRGNNEEIPMKLVHTNGEIDVTMKNFSMKKSDGLEYLVEHKLYCLMPYFAFSIENRLKRADNETAKELYKAELEQYHSLLKKAQENGDISDDEAYTLMELKNNVVNHMNFGNNDVSIKEVEKMTGRVLEIQYETRYNEGVQAGMQAGREEMRQEMMSKMEEKDKEIAKLQRQIMMMSKSSKPVASRGR